MITAVVGIQWGDEGKGKIVDYLSQKVDYVVRFHGGAGAGHTVSNPKGTIKFHLLPSSMFNEKVWGVIANGVVIDPKSLLEEIASVEKLGIRVWNRLLISSRAQVVFPYHKIFDAVFDEAKGDLKTATTRKGNGPVHADKVSYYGIKIHDLLDKKTLRNKLGTILGVKNRVIKEFGGEPLKLDQLVNEYFEYGKKLKPSITDTRKLLNLAISKKKNVIFEGAHGIFLDVDWGTYPYVSASSILPWNVGAGAGINPRKLDKIVGILKVYVTRVDTGACPMPTEIFGKFADELRTKAGEFGATTGRPRRIGWLDLVQIKAAVELCGVTELAIVKADILAEVKEIPVCIGYQYRGKKVGWYDVDTEELRKIKPIYKKFAGWKGDFSKMKKYADLPKNLRIYLEFIEKFTGVKIKLISVGPKREQTILC